ncbi:hypothetical protein FSP39_000428 [Pinctada imbricata]|uniref:Fucosyltransferase n=1 Tax=Pinctada imbricata TaxID=66713 RepID=A0AA88YC01_PINIB|nr:hypothetical protein FSP39_000428 [Pinctada imbricata]
MAQHCPKHNCRLTSDRKYMPEADAVVIEVEGLYKLPRKTKMGQVWVYVEMESPAWRGNGMKTWKNLFNWTMTYRRDSDIPHFYGSLTKKNQEVNRTLRQEMFTSKNKSMLWLVSNCNTPGKREIFVKQLQKFTPVDVVGRCGKHVCPKGNNCEGSLLKNYKFYFAAENSNCRDYITEKAFRPFGHYILPVVRGGGNYSMYFPPKSYIDTDRFKSKKLLGSYRYLRNHLNFVDVHEKIFESYISVIEQYNADIILNQMWVPFCTLCDRLNNQSKFRRLYRSIHDWWRGQERTSGYFCKKDELARL